MAIEKIQIDTNQLSNSIADMQTGINNITNYTNQIYDDINELDSMWDGAANDEFNLQFSKDKEALLKLCREIQTYISDLDYAKNEYNKCESKVAALVNALRI